MNKTIHRTLFLVVLLLLCGGVFLVNAAAEEPAQDTPSETVVTPSEGTGSKDPGSEGATAPTTVTPAQGEADTTDTNKPNVQGSDTSGTDTLGNDNAGSENGNVLNDGDKKDNDVLDNDADKKDGDVLDNGDGKKDGDVLDNDADKKDGDVQNDGDGKKGGDVQNDGDGKKGGDVQNDGDGKKGGDVQNDGDGKKGGDVQNDGDGKKGGSDLPDQENQQPQPQIEEAPPVGETPSVEDEPPVEAEPQPVAAGDFLVIGDAGNYWFDGENGVLFISGDVTVSNKEVATTSQRIVVDADCTVVLNNVNIDLGDTPAPGILIKAARTVTLTLANNSVNTVKGGKDIHLEANGQDKMQLGFAGIEVEWNNGSDFAHLTIDGTGTLNAIGGRSSAGIGGSKSHMGLYGDITIESGTINATAGEGRGAGIGSSDNPADGTSHGSYKYIDGQDWGTITINGGTINAYGKGNGAGIGGGNHTCSGKIIINDGEIYAEGDSGIGSGLGSSNGNGKGPGYYFGDIVINGGTITAHATNNMGAGIGGGMYSDAYVTITGGTIYADVDQGGKLYQGGSGIGGGYQGVAIVNITGGIIHAYGGHGAPGIGNGAGAATTSTKNYDSGTDTWSGTKNIRAWAPTIDGETEASVTISGGTVYAYGGYAGAGIGSGNFTQWTTVNISGGMVHAEGYRSDRDTMEGGAGIGSGSAYVNTKHEYMVQTTEIISITGGDVTAIGGWGAAGIGSGARNNMADEITIDAEKATIQAYADGTKFAIDTRLLNDDGTTTSRKEGRTFTGDLLQGTFVHKGKIGSYEQNPEGLKSIIVTHDATDVFKKLTLMPEGYRSFATDVAAPGQYTVYTDADSIGHGEGRYFNVCPFDQFDENAVTARGVRYAVVTNALSDNFYLYPVKTIVVSKVVAAEDGLDKTGVNTTLWFALDVKMPDGTKPMVTRKDGTLWMESIDVVNGVPQGSAYFVNIEDYTYDVLEMNADGTKAVAGAAFDAMVLKSIETRHGEGTDNDAIITADTWTDRVTVINTYAPVDVPDPEPAPVPDPTPTPGSAPDPKPDPKPKPDPAPVPDPAPDPEPDEPEIIDIPEENVPLAPQPEAVDIPDGDVPLASQPEVIVIPEAEVPLTDKPVKTVPAKTPAAPKTAVVPQPNGLVVIHDLEVPLASTPRTGDETANGLCAALAVSAALGLVVLVRGRKTEE